MTRRGNHSREWGHAGVSLIELLIVVGLLLLLATLYWRPTTGRNEVSRKERCRQNLEKIYLSLQIYANEHQGRFPERPGALTSEEPLDLLVPRYNSDALLFTCPGRPPTEKPAGDSLVQRGVGYAYYMGRRLSNSQVLVSDEQVDTTAKTVGQAVFSSTGQAPGNNHGTGGGNFLFGDGHLEEGPARAVFPLDLAPGIVLLNPGHGQKPKAGVFQAK